jgi:hypothetical protein
LHAGHRVEHAIAWELEKLVEDPRIAGELWLLRAVAKRAVCLAAGKDKMTMMMCGQRPLRALIIQKGRLEWTELEWTVPNFEAITAKFLNSSQFGIPGSKRNW